MPIEFGDITVAQILWSASGLLLLSTLGTIAWKLGVPLIRLSDVFFGRKEIPGVPDSREPGLIERMSNLEKGQESITKQVTPNHGKTSLLTDEIDSIKSTLLDVQSHLGNHIDATNGLIGTLTEQTEVFMRESKADRASLHETMERHISDAEAFEKGRAEIEGIMARITAVVTRHDESLSGIVDALRAAAASAGPQSAIHEIVAHISPSSPPTPLDSDPPGAGH